MPTVALFVCYANCGYVCLLCQLWLCLFVMPTVALFVCYANCGYVCLLCQLWLCLFVMPTVAMFVCYANCGFVCLLCQLWLCLFVCYANCGFVCLFCIVCDDASATDVRKELRWTEFVLISWQSFKLRVFSQPFMEPEVSWQSSQERDVALWYYLLLDSFQYYSPMSW